MSAFPHWGGRGGNSTRRT